MEVKVAKCAKKKSWVPRNPSPRGHLSVKERCHTSTPPPKKKKKKRVSRREFRVQHRPPSYSLLTFLHVLPVDKRSQLKMLLHIYKSLNGMLPLKKNHRHPNLN